METVNIQEKRNSKIFHILIASLYLLMVMFPYSNNRIKIVLLSLLMIYSFFKIINEKFKIYLSTKLILLLVISNAVFVLIGMTNCFEGAINESTVNVIWPICYIIVGSFFPKRNEIRGIIKVLCVGALLISIFELSLLFVQYFQISALYSFFEMINVRQRWGFHSNGTVGFECDNTDGLAFFLSFTAALAFLREEIGLNKDIIGSKFCYICFILTALAVFLTGRTALLLEIFLVILMIVAYKYKDRRITARQLAGIIGWIIAGLIIIIANHEYLFQKMEVLFYETMREFSSDYQYSHNTVRVEQMKALFKGWSESPIFGHGIGSYTKESIRSFDQPWNYELTYNKMLFQKGLIGIGIFACVIFICVWRLYKKVDEKYISIPLCFGLIGVLFANATNPFLGIFNFLWMQYLPILAIDIDKRVT